MGRPRTFDENHAVASARQVFWTSGYHGTSVGDLSVATGLGKGSLYGAFGNKHELFLRLFDEYCAACEASVAALGDGPDTGALDRAADWLRVAAENATTNGCLLAKGTAELSGADPEVAARAKLAFTTLHDSLTELVAKAQRAGDISADADPVSVAGLLLATHRGIEAMGKAGLPTGALVPIAELAIATVRSKQRGTGRGGRSGVGRGACGSG